MQDKTVPERLLKLCRMTKVQLSAADPEPVYLTLGICSMLSAMDDLEPSSAVSWPVVGRYKANLMERWPESSGSRAYPVSVPWEYLTLVEVEALANAGVYGGDEDDAIAGALFDLVCDEALYDGNFWDRGTEYGMARWRLLDWMIEELEKELEK